MSRGGVPKRRPDGPERRCIATGRTRPKRGLVRFVVGPDGQVVPDLAGRLPGRGAHVAADRAALERAVARGLFARAFRRPVKVPEDLVAMVEQGLARRVIGLIGLARKSGEAVAGFEKVKGWLADGRAAVLIQASDGSARERARLRPPADGAFVGCLDSDELGMAFGRQTVIHAALASGGLGKRVVEEAQRLRGLRGTEGGRGRER